MAWLSANPMWEEFGSRALFWAGSGADFGDVQVTISNVGDGDVDDWHREWTRTADRVEKIGDTAAKHGHRLSALQAYLRATTYHRTAYFPIFGPTVSPQLAESSRREWEATKKAAACFEPAADVLEIECDGAKMPAVFVRASDDPAPRATVVCTNGYDSTISEMLLAHALPATARGYHCLLFDGPGQGRTLIDQGVTMRPDWEEVVRPVVDRVVTLPGVDESKIALNGWSFGGFLAPRAASGEPRLAALIADPGQWDQKDAILGTLKLTDEQQAAFPDVDRSVVKPVEDFLKSDQADPTLRWRLLQRGFLVNGTDNLFDYFVELAGYEISSVAANITCPTLLTMGEGDPIAAGAQTLLDGISSKRKDLVHFTVAEGSGGHCEGTSRMLYSQRVYDWLDDVLDG